MNIKFILRDGSTKDASFSDGETVLQVAERNGISLHGNCEGFGVCGGCHIIVESKNIEFVEISEQENDCLDKVKGVTLRSRLACQLILNKKLDGLIVRLA